MENLNYADVQEMFSALSPERLRDVASLLQQANAEDAAKDCEHLAQLIEQYQRTVSVHWERLFHLFETSARVYASKSSIEAFDYALAVYRDDPHGVCPGCKQEVYLQSCYVCENFKRDADLQHGRRKFL